MAVKPTGELCAIREQIFEDRVSGLTFQFEMKPGSDAPVRMRVFGDVAHGNREFLFDQTGAMAGTGTALSGSCRATWIKSVG
jgi:hypothetical protein